MKIIKSFEQSFAIVIMNLTWSKLSENTPRKHATTCKSLGAFQGADFNNQTL